MNVWYDHAAGKGGDILEAVQVFENKSFLNPSSDFLNPFQLEDLLLEKNQRSAQRLSSRKCQKSRMMLC